MCGEKTSPSDDGATEIQYYEKAPTGFHRLVPLNKCLGLVLFSKDTACSIISVTEATV